MEIKFDSFEELDEFFKRYTPKEPTTINVSIPAKPSNKKPVKKQEVKKTQPAKNKFVVFPESVQKRYDLRWSHERDDGDWWILRYKNGQGFKKFELNLLQLCLLKTFNGKLTEKELVKYAKQYDVSETRLKKIIWNLHVGAFNKYFKTVENEVKKIKVNVLRNNNLIINNVETDMTSIEAKGLLFSIQNAPVKAREVLKQYKQFEHKIDMKLYFLLCWNYNNGEILDKIRFGGI